MFPPSNSQFSSMSSDIFKFTINKRHAVVPSLKVLYVSADGDSF